MSTNNPNDGPASTPELQATALRERAEQMLCAEPTEIPTLPTADVQAIVQELHVHQMELQLQNEELREAQVELADARDRYADLFEFAPVGYVVLDQHDVILETNLTMSKLLGVARRDLLQSRLSHFVARDSQDELYLHRQATFRNETQQVCEIDMLTIDAGLLTVRLESTTFGRDEGRRMLTALTDVSNARRAQRDLVASEQRYRRLASSVTDHIFKVRVADGVEREITHSANCEAVTGYTAEEFSADALRWKSIVPEADRARVEHQLRDLLAGLEPGSIEHRIHRKDGTVAWVLRTVSQDLDQQGRLIGYDGLLRDITHKKLAELALQESNLELNRSLTERDAELRGSLARLRLLGQAIAHLGEGVIITGDGLDWPDPAIVFVNEAMCQITGYTADELVGQSPRILQGNDTERERTGYIGLELSAGRSLATKLVNYRKDGTAYDAEVFITPLFDADGKRTHFVSIHRDVTERNQAQAALRDNEEQLRAVLNAAADAIVIMDQRGIISRVNPATLQMFGYTPDELVGQNVQTLMPVPYRDEYEGEFLRYLESGESRIVGAAREAVGSRKDGSTFPVDLALSEVDHLGLFTAIVRDNSERKALQREVLGIAEDEQRRIGQELHDSTQQQLAGIKSMVEALRDRFSQVRGDLPQGSVEWCREIADKVVYNLTHALQEVQTISRGLIPARLERDGLVDALHMLAARTDELPGISCSFDCMRAVDIKNSGTATHIYRIAQEALTNVLKHANASKVLISLKAERGHPVLQVADDGVGCVVGDITEGMGLKIMEYRASLIGAKLTITPIDTGGTLLTCKLLGDPGQEAR